MRRTRICSVHCLCRVLHGVESIRWSRFSTGLNYRGRYYVLWRVTAMTRKRVTILRKPLPNYAWRMSQTDVDSVTQFLLSGKRDYQNLCVSSLHSLVGIIVLGNFGAVVVVAFRTALTPTVTLLCNSCPMRMCLEHSFPWLLWRCRNSMTRRSKSRL